MKTKHSLLLGKHEMTSDHKVRLTEEICAPVIEEEEEEEEEEDDNRKEVRVYDEEQEGESKENNDTKAEDEVIKEELLCSRDDDSVLEYITSGVDTMSLQAVSPARPPGYEIQCWLCYQSTQAGKFLREPLFILKVK